MSVIGTKWVTETFGVRTTEEIVAYAIEKGYDYLTCACGNVETNTLYFQYWNTSDPGNVKCPGCSGIL